MTNKSGKPHHQQQQHQRPRPQRQRPQRLLQTADCHIGIVGSGLAGLSAALAILRSCSSNDDGNNDDNGNGSKSSAAAASSSFRGRISIYERDARLNDRKEGYGMTLTYNPEGPLAKLGVLEEVASKDCPSRCHYLFDEGGNVRGYFGNAFYDDASADRGNNDAVANEGGDESGKGDNAVSAARGAGQRGNLRIPRAELRSILLNALVAKAREAANDATADDDKGNESCGKSRVQILWNKRLLSYEDRPMNDKLAQIHNHSGNGNKKDGQQHQKPVLLQFEDGTSDQVDLLIGADGVNSLVARQYLSTTLPQKKSKKINKDYDNDKIDVNRNNAKGEPMPSTTNNNPTAESIAPRYLGIFIMLGISSHFHPLIDERGFYTLDGRHRLFIMPFSGSRLDDDLDNEVVGNDGTAANSSSVANDDETRHVQQQNDDQSTSDNGSKRGHRRRTMWQLSFPISSEDEALRLSQLSPTEMQAEVLKRCHHWHPPFPSMVQQTPPATIWGTSLLDRDPQTFLRHRASLERHCRIPSRVVLLGDAAHSMTPFKGQGANQALADGPLLAQWLNKSKSDSAVRGFMTEMAQRSGVKVRASRESAKQLHSEECWEWMARQDNYKAGKQNDGDGDGGSDDVTAVFHGVQTQHVTVLLHTLRERGVGASLGAKLDNTIRGIIRELGIAEPMPSSSVTANATNTANKSIHGQISAQEMSHLQSQALQYATLGDMSQLRQLSRKSHLIIPKATDANTQQTCLHLAAKDGHLGVCRWLLTEVNVNCNALDSNGKRAVDLAIDAGQEETARLLKRWMDRTKGQQNSGTSNDNGGGMKDAYRHVEQQLRGIRTVKQLRELLQKNRTNCANTKTSDAITHVLGCHLDEIDEAYDAQCMKTLAEEHGAVLLRNFIPREVDQLALGAMALRPMNFDLAGALETLRSGMNDNAFDSVATIGCSQDFTPSKSEKKQMDKCIEGVKSNLTIPADANVITQTNFGPQLQSYAAAASVKNESNDNAPKKKRPRIAPDSFPLSKLRYINLGEWNYNWGDRQYEKVPDALALSNRLALLAQRAHEIAMGRTKADFSAPSILFDMAICNLYHLQRPSDRLGGHTDNVESDLSLPLVTVSLGAPGIFLLGGTSREDVPTVFLLRAGDCMVMSGKSRGYFHGIPTILSHEEICDRAISPDSADATKSAESLRVFPELNGIGNAQTNPDGNEIMAEEPLLDVVPSLEEIKFVKAFLTTVRMNMSIRQIH